MSKRLYVQWQDLSDWECCERAAAFDHLKKYKQAFGKKPEDELTLLEYAALKNIEPEELFIRLKIDYEKWSMYAIHELIEKLKRKLKQIAHQLSVQPSNQKARGVRMHKSMRPQMLKLKKVNSK
jgi:hypothetical protein